VNRFAEESGVRKVAAVVVSLTANMAGAALAVATIAVVNLMHFSQGWVQFGYRFSNDFAPFAMILVTLGIARAMRRGPWGAFAIVLVAASVLINAWGVYWGVKLGW
jgi:hypothetical protein